MSADGIAFMCFYNAERVLSAIAKFLVHFLGIRRGMERVTNRGQERDRVWGGKWECTK